MLTLLQIIVGYGGLALVVGSLAMSDPVRSKNVRRVGLGSLVLALIIEVATSVSISVH